MYYYEVLVAHQSYHGSDALTYSWTTPLAAGDLVKVSLRNRTVLGIVVNAVEKPGFTVKPMTAHVPNTSVPLESLALLSWIRDYYPAPLGAIVRLFVPSVDAAPKPTVNSATVSRKPYEQPPLTTEQQHAIGTIDTPGSYLLHGITGSGKTRVYVELAAKSLKHGKSAIILTPEIGLTAQLTETFQAAFGASKVYVLHSRLTAAQRRDIWYAIAGSSEPIVVIGPRSALFSPLHSIGLIVLDEAHDGAYKNESAPHYLASRVAAKLAIVHGAIYVSGSATPSVEEYYLASAKQRPIVSMHELAKESLGPTHLSIVDLRKPESFGRSRLLSTTLVDALSACLQRGEQALLFLNRRGTANVVLCSTCGWQSLCPHCDLGLTYHADEHRVRCHVCGYSAPLPTSCPTCGNAEVVLKSIGTKAIFDEVSRLFPSAKVQRFDTDTDKNERIEQKMYSIKSGEIDILVGTQMITKGLDLPGLGLVGIINADTGLLIPDYTATEQTYQAISQVVGRVGRGHRSGAVVVQTYNPDNPVLLAALHADWQAFYKEELTERKAYKFPPYSYLLKLRCLRATSASAAKAAQTLRNAIAETHPSVTIEGPTPSFYPREGGKYSWQLLVKASSRQTLVDIAVGLPSGWAYDIDPINLL